MKKELHQLVDAVRNLGLAATGKPAPGCVKFQGDTKEVPERLLALLHALEAFDRAGGAEMPASAEESARQEEKLKKALNSVFRWMKIQGIDISEPMDLVGDALDVSPGKRKKRYETLPVFAPRGWKKKKGYRPKLDIVPAADDRGGWGDVHKHAFDVQAANLKMGAAGVKETPIPAPGRLK